MAEYLVWPWRPLVGMTEGLEWMTDIIEAHNGNEQRIRVRQYPRQSFEASILLDDHHELSKLRVALAAWQHREWGWPCWHEAVKLGASLAAGSGSISIDTTLADFRTGGLAIIYQSPSLYEVVEIAAVADGLLTLVDATAGTFPAGSTVMPMRMAKLACTITRDDYTGDASRVSASIHVLDNVELGSDPSDMVYLGYDVLSDPLVLPGETMPRQFGRPIETLDPGPGAWATSARTDYPLITTDHRWLMRSPAQAWAFRRWLYRRAGRLNPVWIPSRTHDLVLAAPPEPPTSQLVIHDVGYTSMGLHVPGMSHVAIFSTSGGFVCAEITDAELGDPGQEILYLSTDVELSDIARISFLSLHRFAADRITLTWDRAGVGSCRAAMTSIAIVETESGGGGAPE